ncbi:MAG: DHH family phosphoesterase [Deltaproteobacteria bacterium]|jgi:nanoRNase/pAp phosphatase (c-di-AMP/oligoRNAs hydrolase)|nr:DHH family phosphoesterase [Deltaproteobacteria bacterium]
MSRSVPEKLRRFYDQFSGSQPVLIVINADPDAIASAMAVRRLLWRKVPNVTISNINIINRPDNLAMVRLLGVNLIPFADIQVDKFSRVVIVDSQPDHNEIMSNLDTHVIIDHHPDSGCKAPYVDIRPQYGATSTILTEYLRSAKIQPSSKLATGLYHGIKTDTNDFKGKTQIEDVRAFQYLFNYANIHLARKIEQADLRFDLLKYFKIALQNMRRRKGKVYVHLGNVVNPDVCVLIADFFMRVNTVTWSIVSGFCEKKLIIIFRNDGIRKNAGQVAKEGFGMLGNAGGHKNMARAEIGLGELKDQVDVKDDKKMLSWIIGRTARRAEPK